MLQTRTRVGLTLLALSWMWVSPSPASARIAMEPIREVMRAASPAVRRCVEACVRCPPTDYRISVTFTIDASGTVTEGAVRETDLPEPQVVACVMSVVMHLRFPARSGARSGDVRVNYPFRILAPRP
jgi:hypothetical protein